MIILLKGIETNNKGYTVEKRPSYGGDFQEVASYKEVSISLLILSQLWMIIFLLSNQLNLFVNQGVTTTIQRRIRGPLSIPRSFNLPW